MKKTIKIIFGALIISIILLMMFCYLKTFMAYNFNKITIPESDIMFQSMMQDPYEIIFIQSDGSGYQKVKIKINFVKLNWSSDGERIYGLHNPTNRPQYKDAGFPAFLNLATKGFRYCNGYIYEKIEEYAYSEDRHEVLISNALGITQYDLRTCQPIRMIIDNKSPTIRPAGFSYYKESQILVYSEIWENNTSQRSYHLFRYDLDNGEKVELAAGINPAISADGTKIAYLGMDGLYTMDINGKNQVQILATPLFDTYRSGGHHLAPEPDWSPDGEWLVYHHCEKELCIASDTPILKIRVADGTIEEIYKDGMYPSWRP